MVRAPLCRWLDARAVGRRIDRGRILEKFAETHGLKIGTIADLIRYRLEKEQSVERIAEQPVDTGYGEFTMYCYDDHVNRAVHVALVKGDLSRADNPLVRVHIQDTLGDVIERRQDDIGDLLQGIFMYSRALGSGGL